MRKLKAVSTKVQTDDITLTPPPAEPQMIDRRTLKGQTPLLLAVLADHPSCVRRLLRRGADPNIPDRDGETPLHKACEAESPELVSMLLGFGAAVQRRCLQAWTALHEAASRDQRQICRLLLGAGADVDAANIYGITPLFVAAQSGHHKALSFLLSNGADINRQAADGATPLYEACKNGHDSMVALLLSHQADANKATTSGFLPIHIAAQRGHDGIVGVLLSVTSRLLVRRLGVSPLHVAAEHDQVETLQVLIRAGFDVNTPLSAERSALYRDGRRSALFFSVVNNSCEAASALLRAGADPGLDPVSPLLVAAGRGAAAMVRLLAEHGADVNADTPGRPTAFPPLLLLCMKNTSMLRLLLDRGCDAAACFQCEHRADTHLAAKHLSPDQPGIQFCDVLSSLAPGGCAEPVLRVLLDYVENVRLCSRLTELLDAQGWTHIKDRAKAPRSLKHLSRLQIRRQLGVRRLSLMETLPLPRCLVTYLNHLEHLD
uniref:SOCS box domain-containing protein n=1 Tax=Myripristis murdjan TaxID=586833 RepID=A0A667X1G5_9TELE